MINVWVWVPTYLYSSTQYNVQVCNIKSYRYYKVDLDNVSLAVSIAIYLLNVIESASGAKQRTELGCLRAKKLVRGMGREANYGRKCLESKDGSDQWTWKGMQMTVFPAQTPARGGLRTLLATRTEQSVRCASLWPRITSMIIWTRNNNVKMTNDSLKMQCR